MTGRNGADLYISVPVGTVVSERALDEGVNYDDEEDEDEGDEDEDEEESDEDTKDSDLNQVRILKSFRNPFASILHSLSRHCIVLNLCL